MPEDARVVRRSHDTRGGGYAQHLSRLAEGESSPIFALSSLAQDIMRARLAKRGSKLRGFSSPALRRRHSGATRRCWFICEIASRLLCNTHSSIRVGKQSREKNDLTE